MKFNDDSKITSVKPPKVSSPDADSMVDRILENIGLKREDKGGA